jgi:class 3 adenylate cyclase
VVPEVRYAKTVDGVHIAYQVVGQGAIDLVYAPAFVSHLEVFWEEPLMARWLSRLARFSRLIVFDKRGTGLSDRVAENAVPTLEERMDDIRAVMDAAGSRRAALFGASEGGPMCALFAASYPERTAALVLFASFPRAVQDDDFPEGWLPADAVEESRAQIETMWIEGAFAEMPEGFVEGLSDEEHGRVTRWWGRLCRMSVSPGAAVALSKMADEIDIRHVLASIQAPTLALCRSGDENLPATKYMARHIPRARVVELAGEAHIPAFGAQEPALQEIEEFLTGTRGTVESDRVLATVLFTDIVGSTEMASQLGDEKWAELLEQHNVRVRAELAHFRGREVNTAGDGFLATFDGPARAIRCAVAIKNEVRALGIDVRAGLHTGECELVEDKVQGIAVHTGARVAALAQPGEVLVSGTVKDLVAGSSIRFDRRGRHVLKGVVGRWSLYAVVQT